MHVVKQLTHLKMQQTNDKTKHNIAVTSEVYESFIRTNKTWSIYATDIVPYRGYNFIVVPSITDEAVKVWEYRHKLGSIDITYLIDVICVALYNAHGSFNSDSAKHNISDSTRVDMLIIIKHIYQNQTKMEDVYGDIRHWMNTLSTIDNIIVVIAEFDKSGNLKESIPVSLNLWLYAIADGPSHKYIAYKMSGEFASIFDLSNLKKILGVVEGYKNVPGFFQPNPFAKVPPPNRVQKRLPVTAHTVVSSETPESLRKLADEITRIQALLNDESLRYAQEQQRLRECDLKRKQDIETLTHECENERNKFIENVNLMRVDIESKRDELAKLQSLYNAAQSQITALNTSNTLLLKQKSDIEKILSGEQANIAKVSQISDSERKAATDKINKLEAELRIQEAKYRSLEQDKANEKAQTDATIVQLNRDINDARVKCQATESSLNATISSLTDLNQKTIAKCNADMAELTRVNDEAHAQEIGLLNAQITSLSEALNACEENGKIPAEQLVQLKEENAKIKNETFDEIEKNNIMIRTKETEIRAIENKAREELTALTLLDAEVKQQKLENEGKEKQIRDRELKLAEETRKFENAKTQMEKEKAELAETRKNNEAELRNIIAARDDLNKKIKKNTELVAESSDRESKADAKLRELNIKIEQDKALLKQLTEKQEVVDADSDALRDGQDALFKEKNVLQKEKERLEDLKRNLEVLTEQAKNISDYNEISAKATALTTERNELQAKVTEYEEALVSLYNKNQEDTNKITELTQKLDACINDDLNSLFVENKRIEALLSETTAELSALKTEHASTVKELSSLKTVRSNNETLQNSINDLKNQITKKDAEIQDKIQKLNAEKTALSKQIETEKQDKIKIVDELRSQLVDATKASSSIDTVAKQKDNEIANLNNEKRDLNKKLIDVASKLSTQQSENAKLLSQITSMETSLKQRSDQIELFKKQLSALALMQNKPVYEKPK